MVRAGLKTKQNKKRKKITCTKLLTGNMEQGLRTHSRLNKSDNTQTAFTSCLLNRRFPENHTALIYKLLQSLFCTVDHYGLFLLRFHTLRSASSLPSHTFPHVPLATIQLSTSMSSFFRVHI